MYETFSFSYTETNCQTKMSKYKNNPYIQNALYAYSSKDDIEKEPYIKRKALYLFVLLLIKFSFLRTKTFKVEFPE